MIGTITFILCIIIVIIIIAIYYERYQAVKMSKEFAKVAKECAAKSAKTWNVFLDTFRRKKTQADNIRNKAKHMNKDPIATAFYDHFTEYNGAAPTNEGFLDEESQNMKNRIEEMFAKRARSNKLTLPPQIATMEPDSTNAMNNNDIRVDTGPVTINDRLGETYEEVF